MARWGMEVFDENGDLVIDDNRLLHRLWHVQELESVNDDVTYSEPLEHEPTVLMFGIRPFWPYRWEHKIQNGLYTGILLDDFYWVVTEKALVVVYARM